MKKSIYIQKFAIILAAETFIRSIFFVKNIPAYVRNKFKYIYLDLLYFIHSE